MTVYVPGPSALQVVWNPFDMAMDSWVVGVKKVEGSNFEQNPSQIQFDQVRKIASFCVKLQKNCHFLDIFLYLSYHAVDKFPVAKLHFAQAIVFALLNLTTIPNKFQNFLCFRIFSLEHIFCKNLDLTDAK